MGLIYNDQFQSCERIQNHEELLIRLFQSEDRHYLVDGLQSLSKESIYNRFNDLRKGFSEKELEYLTNIDGLIHFAIGAIVKQNGVNKGIGIARFVRLKDTPECVEIAITVIDHYQNKGVGSILYSHLKAAAKERGYKKILGHIRMNNYRMIKILKKEKRGIFRIVEPGLYQWILNIT